MPLIKTSPFYSARRALSIHIYFKAIQSEINNEQLAKYLTYAKSTLYTVISYTKNIQQDLSRLVVVILDVFESNLIANGR